MKFSFEATGIGSIPLKDTDKACRLIFDNFKSIPFWPQLPKRSYRENMYCQFSEGMPGIVIDEKKNSIHIDSKKAALNIEKVYQKFLEGDAEYFKISETFAEGLYRFCDVFKKKTSKNADFVKGHITGPVSFALSVTDETKRSVIYDKDVFDAVIKALSMKARWQARFLKNLNKNVIIFIDEPYLVSIGSSFINISLDAAAKAIDEVKDSIRKEGALSGIHCCGNTDWPLLLKRGIDIINFDAYNFMKEFSLYSDDIREFLNKGGTIGWGIVPSSEAIDGESAAALKKKLEKGISSLSDKGIDTQNISSLITPSCGLGTLEEERAERILTLTAALSSNMKRL